MADENICRWIPTVGVHDELIALNFVYEKHWNNTRPQLSASFVLHIVSAGNGRLVMAEKEHCLKPGDLFFTFQAREYTLYNDCGFEFMYVGFVGTRALALLTRFGIDEKNPVRSGFSELLLYWRRALLSCPRENPDLAAQAVLYDAFSVLPSMSENEGKAQDEKNMALEIKRYLDEHFREPGVTLSVIAARFGYCMGYIGARFKKEVGVSVSGYLTARRMEYALALIGQGCTVVSQISRACGYTDPLYFSKVFKSFHGIPPRAACGEAKRYAGC